MVLAALILAAQTPPRAPEPSEMTVYVQCVVTKAQGRMGSTEAADAIARSAAFECRQKLPAAARALDQASDAFMRSRGWTLPSLGKTQSSDVQAQLEAAAENAALTAVNEGRRTGEHTAKAVAPRGYQSEFRLTQEGGGLCCYLSEDVIFSLELQRHSWFIERRRREAVFQTEYVAHQWASAKDCPALSAIMNELPDVRKADRKSAPERKLIFVTDTPLLTLTTIGKQPSKQSESEWQGPLVKWWQSAVVRLKSCWNDYPSA